MEYPINIDLYKLETLEDAKYPQEEKYPSGTVIKTGYMWEHTKPKVGEEFYIFQSKTYYNFRTSQITEIIEETKEYIIFKTLNSKYKVKYVY